MNSHREPGNMSRPLGKGMIIAAWVLLLALLTWFFNDRLEQQRNPNRQLAGSVTAEGMPAVVLERNRYGHYVASGFINGRPVEFMLVVVHFKAFVDAQSKARRRLASRVQPSTVQFSAARQRYSEYGHVPGRANEAVTGHRRPSSGPV